MSKIGLIIKREYTTRVRKKSFIVMTLIGPLLFGGIMFAPIIIANAHKDATRVVVVDNTHIFSSPDAFKDGKNIHYDFGYCQYDSTKVTTLFKDSEHVSVLVIPAKIIDYNEQPRIYSKSGTSDEVLNDVERQLDDMVGRAKLGKDSLSTRIVDEVKNNIRVRPVISANTELDYNIMLGYIASFLIYFFIFLYSVQVMRGVMEEKINRIVEVIISSVKPFQLMIGKVIGVALVGFTQFIMWVILGFGVFTIGTNVLQTKMTTPKNATEVRERVFNKGMPQSDSPIMTKAQNSDDKAVIGLNHLDDDLRRTNWLLIIPMFIFYFLGGYLLYSSLFAAIGSAVDQETENQQFMLPVTAPLILSIIAMQYIVQEPHSSLAIWFSMIPLTSPIAMMARIPFGISAWELIPSMLLLLASIIGTIWMAGRIYRVGLLMYGKKVTYKELGKWLFYK